MKIYRYPDPHSGDVAYCVERHGHFYRATGSPFAKGGLIQGPSCPQPTELLPPIAPSAIIGIALNYKAHSAEMGRAPAEYPTFFVKLPNSVQAPQKPIRLPGGMAQSHEVDFEAELAVVIGKRCCNVSRADAMQYVLGYTLANDVSARDWQYKWGGGQFCRAKSFDTFCPLGPCIVTADLIPNPEKLTIRGFLNNELVQESSLDQLIFDIPTLIEFLSSGTTLEAGTVILTGTPSGVGHKRTPPRYLQAGDRFRVEIAEIGSLENSVEIEG